MRRERAHPLGALLAALLAGALALWLLADASTRLTDAGRGFHETEPSVAGVTVTAPPMTPATAPGAVAVPYKP